MIGGQVGPIGLIYAETIFGSQTDEIFYWDVPLALYYGFAFPAKSDTSGYVKLGVIQHLTGGDGPEDSSPGLFGAIGVEFLRTRVVGVGVELSYDGSEVEFERTLTRLTETIMPGQTVFSVRVVF